MNLQYSTTHTRSISCAVLILGGLVFQVAASLYPDMPVFEPTSQYPAGFSAFAPSVNPSLAIPESAPQIAEWTRQGEPGDVIALTGEHLSLAPKEDMGADTSFKILSNEVELDVGVLRLDEYQCNLDLPNTLPINDVYLLYPRNSLGYGEPVAINQAEIWWIGPNELYANEPFSVYGRNLTLDGVNAYAYIGGYGWISTTNCNAYKADFVCPANLASGTYTIHAHNGHGRKYGFSEAYEFMVVGSPQWDDNSTTWLNVKDFGAVGDGVADDYQAVKGAIDAVGEWGTVYFPVGTYAMAGRIRSGIQKVRLIGDGMDVSSITCHSTYLKNSGEYGMFDVTNARDALFSNMALTVSDGFYQKAGGESLYTFRAAARLSFDNVKFSILPLDAWSEILKIERSSNITFRDCIFEICRAVYLAGCEAVMFDHCDFYGVYDANHLIGGGGGYGLSFSHCSGQHFDGSDASESRGWGKGRFLAVASGGLEGFYFGDSLITNYQVRVPTPYWEGGVITDIGTQGPAYRDPRSPGNLGVVSERTFTFADIPAEYHGRANGSIDYSGGIAILPIDGGSTTTGYIKELDAINNTLTLYIKENQFSRTNRITEAATTTAALRALVDQNAGEMLLFEHGNGYGGSLWRGSPVGATKMNISFSSGVLHRGSGMMIVDGRGVGQYRRIVSWEDETAVIEKPWHVVPDSTSIVHLGNWFAHLAIYNSEFSASDPDVYTAANAVQLTGGGHSLIMDSCSVSDVRTGMWIDAYGFQNYHAGTNYISPCYFIHCKDNVIQGAKSAMKLGYNLQPGTLDPYLSDAILLGVTYQGNEVLNCDTWLGISANAYVKSSTLKHYWGVIFNDNISSNNMLNMLTDDEVDDHLFVRNTLTGSGEAFSLGPNQSPYILDNTLNGHSTLFSGGLEGPVLEVPYRRITVTADDPTIDVPIYNCGTASLDWSVTTDDTSWLSVPSPSGNVARHSSEGRITVDIDTSKAPDLGEALLTVHAAGIAKSVLVVYSAGDDNPPQRVFSFPFLESGLFKAELYDASGKHLLREWDNIDNTTPSSPARLTIDLDLQDASWYKLKISKYNVVGGLDLVHVGTIGPGIK